MSKYDIVDGKAMRRKPKLFDEEEFREKIAVTPTLRKAAEFRGPSPENKVSFDENDLVSVPEAHRSSSSVSGYGNIISGAAKGLSDSLNQNRQMEMAKQEIADEKRRRFAQLLARARKRDSEFADLLTDQGDATRDYQSQAIQDVARGFAETFRR